MTPIIVRASERYGFEMLARLMSWAGYLWMAVLLLFFSASLLFDLYRLLVHLAGLAPPDRCRRVSPVGPDALFCSARRGVDHRVLRRLRGPLDPERNPGHPFGENSEGGGPDPDRPDLRRPCRRPGPGRVTCRDPPEGPGGGAGSPRLHGRPRGRAGERSLRSRGTVPGDPPPLREIRRDREPRVLRGDR